MTWNVVGHAWAIRALQRDLALGRPAHAYLFAGPAGIGKRTLALAFAQALNCAAPPAPGEACGACRPCRQIAARTHPDLFVLLPQEPGKPIKVEAAREMMHMLALSPLELQWRVGLLANFDQATSSTANALLKTLEEPPASVILLLTAESAETLLPTIVSRCRVITLRTLPRPEVEAALTDRWHVPPDRAKLLAHLSGGRLGWALREVEEQGASQARRDTLDAWRSVFTSSRAKRFEQVARLTKEGDEEQALRRTLEMWQSLTHDLLLAGIDSQAPLTNLDFADEIRALAASIPAAPARRWLAALQRVERGLERNLNLRLALEAALLEAPSL
ncbi:MAG: DNA polymerase III subunit delta' [Chloroflexi bacterium RBG_16_64_43]|nr:MAG: DNA polymerase III subunit delta' [Chloroflexi bacterium RBG_16_64_43]